MLDLTFSSETIDIGWGPVSLTKFADPRLERVNSFSQYFYIDPTSEYYYIYFEMFELYRCIVKYTFDDQDLDVEIINNTDHEVLLKTDDLDLVVDKVEELYMDCFRAKLS
jgi:hypothetical protein